MSRNHSTAFAVAALSVNLTVSDNAPPREFRLLPYGRFKAADGSGRPVEVPEGWLLDVSAAEALVASFNARSDARVIDFEHQTLHTASNGKPAPAAGWIGKLEARDDGIYAVGVEWTADAAAMIAAKQYRYISPVFSYDKRTGRVLAVAHAALTNFAGLDRLTDLAAMAAKFFTPEKEPQMKDLLKALGLPETATEAEALAALAALKTSHQGELAALKGIAPDPARFVEVATLTAVQGELSAARTELASLKAEKHAAEVDKVVTAALAAGKLTPATEAWARHLGKSDLAALNAYIEAAPVVVKPGETQSGGRTPEAQAEGALDEAQAALCARMGLKPEDYLAAAGQSANA